MVRRGAGVGPGDDRTGGGGGGCEDRTAVLRRRGVAGTELTGREHNDPYRAGTSIPQPPSPSGAQSSPQGEGGKSPVYTTSNYSGGIQGGISNGMPITMRAAFKPTATIMSEQDT